MDYFILRNSINQYHQINTTDFNNILSVKEYNYNSLQSAYSYLKIRGQIQGLTLTGLQTIFIKSIKIEETPPPIQFSLSPTSVAIACNSNSTKTFTVNNNNATPGVTGYQ